MQEKEALNCYRQMLLIRRFEEKAGQLYGMGKIGGFCHLYIGQEAVAVGVRHVIEERDTVITSYRDHGAMLAQGSDPKIIMAELLGKKTGCSGGKGGSMHIFDLEKNFFGGHGIVGAQVPIGSGLAFAHKYRGNGAISITYLGDGAINQGQVYESFNMAALWKLPVLYIIENNMYGMGTSVERASANTKLYNRGESFGIPGYQADGMNILEVINCAGQAVKHVREGNGPALIEFKTYRYRGHSMSDPATYRAKDEVNEYREQHDPLNYLKNYIINNPGNNFENNSIEDNNKGQEMVSPYSVDNKLAITEKLRIIEKEVKDFVNEVVQFAESSDFPAGDELYTNIYN